MLQNQCQWNKLVPVNLCYRSHKQPRQSWFFFSLSHEDIKCIFVHKNQSEKSSTMENLQLQLELLKNAETEDFSHGIIWYSFTSSYA